MKKIKTFEKYIKEEDLIFKEGDYVRCIRFGDEIFKIDYIFSDIEEDKFDKFEPYHLTKIGMENINNRKFNGAEWAAEEDLTLVPDYELNAIKYNL